MSTDNGILSESTLLLNGFEITNHQIHATEYTNFLVGITLYSIPSKTINIIVDEVLYYKIKDLFAGTLYHNTALKSFSKRCNKGKRPIHYGYQIKFKNLDELNLCIKELIK